jgi:hypothetical protein
MSPAGKALLVGTVAAGSAVGGGYAWWRLSPETFPFPHLFPAPTPPAGSPGVSLVVEGYALASGGGLGQSVAVHPGDVVVGAVRLTAGSGSRPLRAGVRAWLVQLGANLAPGRYLQLAGGGYAGTVEGHLFAHGTRQLVTPLWIAPGQQAEVQMHTGALDLPAIAWAGPPQLAVIWASGPLAEIVQLPRWGGVLPAGSMIAYAVTTAAIVEAS